MRFILVAQARWEKHFDGNSQVGGLMHAEPMSSHIFHDGLQPCSDGLQPSIFILGFQLGQADFRFAEPGAPYKSQLGRPTSPLESTPAAEIGKTPLKSEEKGNNFWRLLAVGPFNEGC